MLGEGRSGKGKCGEFGAKQAGLKSQAVSWSDHMITCILLVAHTVEFALLVLHLLVLRVLDLLLIIGSVGRGAVRKGEFQKKDGYTI